MHVRCGDSCDECPQSHTHSLLLLQDRHPQRPQCSTLDAAAANDLCCFPIIVYTEAFSYNCVYNSNNQEQTVIVPGYPPPPRRVKGHVIPEGGPDGPPWECPDGPCGETSQRWEGLGFR